MLSPKFKTAVQTEIRRARESGQSEGVALSDFLETLCENEDMSKEVLLAALYQVEDRAYVIRQNLLGRGERPKGPATLRSSGNPS